MTEHWQIVVSMTAVIVFVNGLTAAFTRWMTLRVVAEQNTRHDDLNERQETKYKELANEVKKQCEGLSNEARGYQGVREELLVLKAELPLGYVRREDFIREELTINTKLDRLRDLIMLREGRNGND